jgi:hypothetical protein
MPPLMSELDDTFADEGMPTLLESAGDTVVHIDGDGTETELTAIVGPAQIRTRPTRDGFERERWRWIQFSRDPAGEHGGVANPQLTDYFEIDGEKWSVADETSRTADEIVMELIRTTTVEKHTKSHGRGRG